MSELYKKIETDMVVAAKSKDKLTLGVLRFLKSSLDVLKKDKGKDLTDEEVIAGLKKRIKQGKESVEKFAAGNRADLVDTEKKQLEIVSAYLPKQMTEEEIEALTEKVILQSKASSQKDFGKVMGLVVKEVAGRADGKLIKSIVEKKLT